MLCPSRSARLQNECNQSWSLNPLHSTGEHQSATISTTEGPWAALIQDVELTYSNQP